MASKSPSLSKAAGVLTGSQQIEALFDLCVKHQLAFAHFRLLFYLHDCGPLNTNEIRTKLKCSEATARRVATDLVNFCICTRTGGYKGGWKTSRDISTFHLNDH
jgi:predicted transcriptional regulator